MRRFWMCAAVLAAVFGAAQAESAECRDPMDQNTMNRCADEDFQVADKALNDMYKKVVAGQEGETAKLKAAQRAWIAFRDAECTFQTAENEGGSIHPMVYAGCLTRLTKERTRQLNDYLECRMNAEKCGE